VSTRVNSETKCASRETASYLRPIGILHVLIGKCRGAIFKVIFFLKNIRKLVYESSCSMCVLHFNLGCGWLILTKLVMNLTPL
jgi:hypothetical protein